MILPWYQNYCKMVVSNEVCLLYMTDRAPLKSLKANLLHSWLDVYDFVTHDCLKLGKSALRIPLTANQLPLSKNKIFIL